MAASVVVTQEVFAAMKEKGSVSQSWEEFVSQVETTDDEIGTSNSIGNCATCAGTCMLFLAMIFVSTYLTSIGGVFVAFLSCLVFTLVLVFGMYKVAPMEADAIDDQKARIETGTGGNILALLCTFSATATFVTLVMTTGDSIGFPYMGWLQALVAIMTGVALQMWKGYPSVTFAYFVAGMYLLQVTYTWVYGTLYPAETASFTAPQVGALYATLFFLLFSSLDLTDKMEPFKLTWGFNTSAMFCFIMLFAPGVVSPDGWTATGIAFDYSDGIVLVIFLIFMVIGVALARLASFGVGILGVAMLAFKVINFLVAPIEDATVKMLIFSTLLAGCGFGLVWGSMTYSKNKKKITNQINSWMPTNQEKLPLVATSKSKSEMRL